MPLPKLERPIVFLDIESTGLNRATDRIVELGMVKVHPDGARVSLELRLDPQIPIPAETTRFHGISDADVQGCQTFAQAAPDIAAFIEGCDLGGYNLIHFDVPMLEEEFKRAGLPISFKRVRLIDAQKIFHRREPRDLAAALAFYCGERHDNAHSALADAEAALKVLEGQYEKYPDLPGTIPALADYCVPREGNTLDREGRLRLNDDGQIAINFGQNKGKLLADLAQTDKPFLRWILNKDFPDDVKEIVRRALEEAASAATKKSGPQKEPL